MKYFKFPIIKKQLKENKKNTVISKILDFVFSFIPKSNPQFDNLIQFVDVWYIEYDDENDCVEKEVGLSSSCEIIIKMPFKNEYGYWLDTDMKFQDFEHRFNIEIIHASDFFKKWNELQ
jgi:hypothetical protein